MSMGKKKKKKMTNLKQTIDMNKIVWLKDSQRWICTICHWDMLCEYSTLTHARLDCQSAPQFLSWRKGWNKHNNGCNFCGQTCGTLRGIKLHLLNGKCPKMPDWNLMCDSKPPTNAHLQCQETKLEGLAEKGMGGEGESLSTISHGAGPSTGLAGEELCGLATEGMPMGGGGSLPTASQDDGPSAGLAGEELGGLTDQGMGGVGGPLSTASEGDGLSRKRTRPVCPRLAKRKDIPNHMKTVIWPVLRQSLPRKTKIKKNSRPMNLEKMEWNEETDTWTCKVCYITIHSQHVLKEHSQSYCEYRTPMPIFAEKNTCAQRQTPFEKIFNIKRKGPADMKKIQRNQADNTWSCTKCKKVLYCEQRMVKHTTKDCLNPQRQNPSWKMGWIRHNMGCRYCLRTFNRRRYIRKHLQNRLCPNLPDWNKMFGEICPVPAQRQDWSFDNRNGVEIGPTTMKTATPHDRRTEAYDTTCAGYEETATQ